jgi:3-deoxy-D-manno-octulosonate 8-phosphate phosphatase KdsC-like HAD superfamily phosphatase
MNKKYWFVIDIDGVITDGCVSIDREGEEYKRLNLKDIDAIYELAQRGHSLAVVTSEANGFTEWVKSRFPWDQFYSGIQYKLTALKQSRVENKIEKDCLIYTVLPELCNAGIRRYAAP